MIQQRLADTNLQIGDMIRYRLKRSPAMDRALKPGVLINEVARDPIGGLQAWQAPSTSRRSYRVHHLVLNSSVDFILDSSLLFALIVPV